MHELSVFFPLVFKIFLQLGTRAGVHIERNWIYDFWFPANFSKRGTHVDFGMGKNEEISLGLRQSHIETIAFLFINKMDQFEIKGVFKRSLTTNNSNDMQF